MKKSVAVKAKRTSDVPFDIEKAINEIENAPVKKSRASTNELSSQDDDVFTTRSNASGKSTPLKSGTSGATESKKVDSKVAGSKAAGAKTAGAKSIRSKDVSSFDEGLIGLKNFSSVKEHEDSYGAVTIHQTGVSVPDTRKAPLLQRFKQLFVARKVENESGNNIASKLDAKLESKSESKTEDRATKQIETRLEKKLEKHVKNDKTKEAVGDADAIISEAPASIAREERHSPFGIFARIVMRPSPEERELSARKAEAKKQRKLIEARVAATERERKQEEAARIDEETDPRLRIKKKKERKTRSVKKLLALAGVEEEPMTIYRKIFNAAIGAVLALTALALVMGYFFGQTFANHSRVLSFLGFIAALWTVGLIAMFITFGLFYAVYLDLLINKRRKEIEAVFPDYLQLASANLSAGMTIDRALWSAVRPRFGILAKEMEDVAKKTMTGYDLESALQEFSEKYDSLVIKRSVDLLCEGIRSGGRLAEILNRIAVNIQENEILQKEMAANVTTYVIFISFASVAAAPFLFGLATQLLIVIQHIAGNIALSSPSGGGGGGGLSLSANAVSLDDFKIFAMTILGVSSTMSACIVSVIRKGTVKDGLRLIPFFFVISLALYYFSIWALGFMFSRFLA